VIALFDSFRDGMYLVLKFFQHATAPVMGGQSYWFSIVLLTLAVRIVLIPLTVKQVRSTRAMQDMAPKIKQVQAKHKNDKQKMNEELMKLYKEHGINPLAGCWPLVAQMPFFFALYRVIYSKHLAGETNILLGKNFFGVPLEQRWSQLQGWDKLLSVSGATILVLIIGMAVTTFISQRQLMSKQAQQVNPQQATMMKIMPLFFVFISINFPLAVVVYWVTTNLWTMGQQWVLLRNQPQPAAAGASAGGGGGQARTAKQSPATAPALAPDGEERKGLSSLGLFRGLIKPPQPEASGGAQGQGAGSANAGAGKNGSGGGSGRVNPQRDAGPGQKQKGGDRDKAGPQGGGKQGPSGGGNARRPGGGSRSRTSGKGKSSGPRRGKR
jgi:YidC/Oxa1 family membrane protein insertase